jgi:hypothetical protein
MNEYTPKQRRDFAESFIGPGLNDRAAAPAPMDTVAKPANGGKLSEQFTCLMNSNDVMTVMKDYAYKAVVFAANDGDESVEIYLSYADARALAEKILASI